MNIHTYSFARAIPRYGKGELEEEVIDAYNTSMKRLKAFVDKEFGKKLEEELLR